MPLHFNCQLLKTELEGLALLNGRYEQLKLVNYDSIADEKRGCFSMVFQAYDRVNDRLVALKFFDPSPDSYGNSYRRACFDREHTILTSLINKIRCLQLLSGMETFNLPLPLPNGGLFEFPCKFFAVEWIDGELDGYFLNQGVFDPADKLRLFNELVLAVETMHRYETFHRDLKRDNIRSYKAALKRIVVAIDLGTAAKFDSASLNSDYVKQVGALAYASPEAQCGLASYRSLAPLTDIYGLGCMLFELFNMNLFYNAMVATNPRYHHLLAALTATFDPVIPEDKRLLNWSSTLPALTAGIVPVDIAGPGSNVPASIAPILNDVVAALTHINYRNRTTNLQWVRSRIRIAIEHLDKASVRERQARFAALMRIRREDARARRAEALNRHLALRIKK